MWVSWFSNWTLVSAQQQVGECLITVFCQQPTAEIQYHLLLQ